MKRGGGLYSINDRQIVIGQPRVASAGAAWIAALAYAPAQLPVSL
ncbi:hypothetical protein CAter282_4240 [Collimonas arenae]|uniref:Uncharacterized protein n=1 Tax=Collimonas arenae TaxID=279058 RepID=A0A127QP61_9BURK|nr:hypothetical protein CAter10_4614 [Collimonas arenae]AMP11900.1 hypothetical protein CAter282_4240 [Collimonas arenae]